ncbi:MAG TPA: octaprenyl diphosphate synthase [Methylococcaceae bacterium]|nr:octaprenyl diphosphate synthase [Methylococcaceae bacterium]
MSSNPENPSAKEGPQQFSAIRALVSDDMRTTDSQIVEQLSSDVVLINQIGHYIVNSGGKRLRPMLMLLIAKALGYKGPHHVTLAAVLEFIHTATLLHDDVVDDSTRRRGQDTANQVWGNSASVLVGDFLYSRAFEMMVGVHDLRIMEVMSSTTTAIAEGEVMQLLNCNNPATAEEDYLKVIARKTAILFAAAAQCAAILVHASPAVESALKEYGLLLGTAFQLIDDVLDYRASPDELGKNLGDDLADGKPTLPLIYALRQGSPEQAAILSRAIENGDRDAFASVFAIIESTDALAYTERRARDKAQRAIEMLDCIPSSDYKDALVHLAEFSVARSH